MKKIVQILIVTFISIQLFASLNEKSTVLNVNATVAEDHGIIFPENVYHMDHIYFEIDSTLVSNKGITIDYERGSMDMSLLYYGNQSTEQNFVFSLPLEMWWLNGNKEVVKIDAAFSDASYEDDITVAMNGVRSVVVTIPPTGPRRGEKILNINFSWSLSPDLKPATLTFPLDLQLGVLL